ncbi:MAG: DUF5906 domain-containing protein [Candidatus Dactylopiibacterium sp.]|nr:DUF5906 domain-containing protein [Candidatus Dactylopiibacterium sp.]
MNEHDVLDQLRAAGLVVELPLDLARGTKSRRCFVSDDGGSKREKRGWYRLYEWVTSSGECFLTGSYGVYRGDDPGTQKVELTKRCESCGYEMALKARECPSCKSKAFKRRELSAEEQAAIKARQAEDKKRAVAERQAEIERAASWAREVWRVSVPATPDAHDYFARKGLKGTGDTRIFPGVDGVQLEGAEPDDYRYLASFAGALVIPMCDLSGRVFGVQFILSRACHADRIRQTERDKEYWPAGLSKDEHYWTVGVPERLLLLAEGYATAQTLHDATGHAVAVTFDAGNQPKVAKALRKHYKRAQLLICGDDDWLQKCAECKSWTPVAQELCAHCGQPHRKQNAGRLRAQEAAMTADGSWVLPVFSVERPDTRKGPTDFNDLACAEGLQMVRAQVEAKLSEIGIAPEPIPLATPLAAGSSSGGAGESLERPPAMSVMTLDAAVDRFVPLDDGTGAYLFDTWTRKIASTKQMIAVLPAGVRWDDVKRHPRWVSRGAYYLGEVGFDPAGDDHLVKLNTWQGWPMQPKRGNCERLLELLTVLCANEVDASGENIGAKVAHWLLCWMAYPLQHPGAKMSSAVIMHGPQGTGKSTVFQTLARIYGDYATVLNQRGLEDKFNADWVDSKLFVLAEEVVTKAEMWHIKNELKELVTGEWIRINPKNVAAYRQRNHINIVYLSNENQPLPLDNDDRRHLVVYTPPPLGEEFYDQVHLELEQGGAEAFYDYLLSYDTSGFHPKKRPPMTQSKVELIQLSKSSEDRFLEDWISGETPWPFVPCLSDDLYRAYRLWCNTKGVARPRESNMFIGVIKRRPGWAGIRPLLYADTHYVGKPKQASMIRPSDTALRASGLTRPEQKTDTQWLTDCKLRFANALEGL